MPIQALTYKPASDYAECGALKNKEEIYETLELLASFCKASIAFITINGNLHLYIQPGYTTAIDLKAWITNFHPANTGLLETEIPDLCEIKAIDHTNGKHLPTTIRFYAGMPLFHAASRMQGYICVLHTQAQRLSPLQKRMLRITAQQIIQLYQPDLPGQLLKAQLHQAKQTETKLRSFTEGDQALQMLINKDLQVITFNKGMADFIRCKHDVNLYEGIPVSAILHGRLLERSNAEFAEVLAGSKATFDRRLAYSGQHIWWHVKLEPFYSEEGEIIGISYSAKDITDKKGQEQTVILQKSNLRKIAFDLSHDLRQQVASILGIIEIFKLNDYKAEMDEIRLLEQCANHLDNKIRSIIGLTT